jgi:translocation and assembly module TamA
MTGESRSKSNYFKSFMRRGLVDEASFSAALKPMVDEALTKRSRAFASWFVRALMRFLQPLPGALCLAIGLGVAAPHAAFAENPVVIEGVNHDDREAILDLLPDRDRPTTLFEAERIAEEAASRATAWLRSEGYYAAEVTPETQTEPPSARLRIAPGARFHFADPSVAFTGAPPTAEAQSFARDAIAVLHPGAPARAGDVLSAEAEAVSRLQRSGYADAKAGPRRVVVDHATALVTPAFDIEAGDFVRLGKVRAQPGDVFRRRFIERLANWDEGEPYDPEKLARLRRDLSSTGAVSRISTRLVPSDTPGVRDVVLDIEPAKRNVYEVGLGFSTTEGAGFDGEWTRRNFSGRADSLALGFTLSEKTQDVSLTLTRPHAAGLGHAQHFTASLEHEDTDAFSRQGFELSAAVEAESRLRFGLSYGVALSGDTYDEASGVENALSLTTFGEVRRDTTGSPLDARHGSIVTLRAEPTFSTGDASVAFVRAIADGRIYRSFGTEENWTLAGRARTGWLAPFSGDANDAPPDRRFYAGGGGSVRGYAYNSIYPKERDALGLSPGGQGALELSGEVRYRFAENFGLVTFLDGGNAFDDWGDAADLRWAAGVGFRYNLGFAPLRADIAFPLDAEDGDDAFALYISIGQAF